MFKSLSSIIKNITHEHQRNSSGLDGFDFLTLNNNWESIVGSNLAKHTCPLKIKNKTLYILSDHPAFSSTLNEMSGPIKQKIFDKYPTLKRQITKLYFQVNEQYFKRPLPKKTILPTTSAKLPKLHPYSPEYQLLKKQANELLNQIEDPDLKNQLTSIFIQMGQRNE